MTRLRVDLQALAGAPLSLQQAAVIKSIEHIDIIETTAVDASIDAVISLLSHFPCLRLLSCWTSLTDHQLLALRTACPSSLQGMHLTNCKHLSPAAIAQFVCSIPCMKVLHLPALDAPALTAITQHCHGLTTLSICTEQLKSTEALEHLCAVNPLLTSLTLSGGVPDDALVRIVTEAVHLQHFSCTSRGAKSAQMDVIRAIIAHCPEICAIILSAVYMYFDRSKQLADVCQTILPSNEEQQELLKLLPYPMCSYQLDGANSSAAVEVFEQVTTSCGDRLESLEISFSMAFNEQFAVASLHRCPNLTSFKAQPTSVLLLAETVFPALTASCKKLRKVEIGAGGFLQYCTYSGKGSFLGLPSTLEELHFTGRMAVYGDSLRGIADSFPCLQAFTSVGDMFEKEVLLDVIISGKLKAKRITLFPPIAVWIAEQLRLHIKIGYQICLAQC